MPVGPARYPLLDEWGDRLRLQITGQFADAPGPNANYGPNGVKEPYVHVHEGNEHYLVALRGRSWPAAFVSYDSTPPGQAAPSHQSDVVLGVRIQVLVGEAFDPTAVTTVPVNRLGDPAAAVLADPASRPAVLPTEAVGEARFAFLPAGGCPGPAASCTTMAIGGFDDVLVIIEIQAPPGMADARVIAHHLRWLDRAGWKAAVDARFRAAPVVRSPSRPMEGPMEDEDLARDVLTPLYVRSRP